MPLELTVSRIAANLDRLPAFPPLIAELIGLLDDDEVNMVTLARKVERDPVLTGRILYAANGLLRLDYRADARDVYTAASYIGFARIRDIVFAASIANYINKFKHNPSFWKHCLTAGIAAQELARNTNVHPSHALIAGLLHDIGWLWMFYFHPFESQQVRLRLEVHNEPVLDVEHSMFGVNHCIIGQQIAQYWKLPQEIVAAIAHHHIPSETAANDALTAITHLAENIVNALDIPCRDDNQVQYVSATACRTLGIDRVEDFFPILGSIEARCKYLTILFH
ncbi:MAG: HDOD domain-containing protein [Azoarcus sp.]|jgi:putative nucleotidyltransferase with HDIG domain|nr:HDOD domain-containing protein [Azoarcus sp.]